MLPTRIFNAKALHPDRDKVFKDDILSFFVFLKEELGSSEISFSLFKKCFKIKKIKQFHFIAAKGENWKEYYETLFGEVQSFWLIRIHSAD